MVNDDGLDTMAACALESLRVGAIRDDDTNLGLEVAAPNRVDDRLQIGAGAGNQDPEFDRRIFRHRIGSEKRNAALSARHFADDMGSILATPQMGDDSIGLARGHDRDHAEAVVEGAIHLAARDPAEPLNQAEDRRYRPTVAPDDRASVFRHHARQVFDHAAAGNIRKAVYPETFEQFDHDARVDQSR